MFKTMSADKYLPERLEQFQGWYDKKAIGAKSWYLRVRVTAVVGSIIVPISANIISDHEIARYTTTVISLIVSLAVGLDSVFHYGDQWRNYRATEQFLSREKFMFQTGEGSYRDVNPERAFSLLVDRCEAQIAAENSATLNVIATSSQEHASTDNH